MFDGNVRVSLIFFCHYFLLAGSLYAQSVQFEVHKGIENTNDILSVVVPQELRGRSEVVIFLADRPIKGM